MLVTAIMEGCTEHKGPNKATAGRGEICVVGVAHGPHDLQRLPAGQPSSCLPGTMGGMNVHRCGLWGPCMLIPSRDPNANSISWGGGLPRAPTPPPRGEGHMVSRYGHLTGYLPQTQLFPGRAPSSAREKVWPTTPGERPVRAPPHRAKGHSQ